MKAAGLIPCHSLINCIEMAPTTLAIVQQPIFVGGNSFMHHEPRHSNRLEYENTCHNSWQHVLVSPGVSCSLTLPSLL